MLPPAADATSQQLSNPSLANSANGLQNSMQIQPQNQVPFCNPNTHMSNVHGHPVANMPSSVFQPGLMNVPNHLVPLHNNPLGMPQFGSFLHSAQSGPGYMGFASQNNGCNMSSVAAFPAQGPFNLVPNVNQMSPCLPLAQFFGQNIPNLVQQLNQSMGLSNGQLCLPYQNINQHTPGQMSNMSQVPHPPPHNPYGGPNLAVPMVRQNPALSVNQPFGGSQVLHPVNQNPQNFLPQTTGANGSRPFPGSGQRVQGNSTVPFNSLAQPQQARNLQSSAFTGSQGNSSTNDGGNRPNSCLKNLAHRNFTRNSKKGFQKNQIHHMKNEKKKYGFPSGQKGKGFHNERKNKFGGTSSTNQVKDQKRSLSLSYTEQEIQQWREARRKNYPSSANIQKRLAGKQTDCTLVDREAKLLRQELKEILAKQAELGVEVADIPFEYLSYTENCDKKKRHDKRDPRDEAEDGSQHTEGLLMGKEKSCNRFNKRGKRDKRNRSRKKVKLEKCPSNTSSLNRREPTLLQKLLKADMKKDKRQLLQGLRFMVMNSFFKEWPNKPLTFPSVIVKENGCEINMVDEKSMPAGNFISQWTNNGIGENLGNDNDNANNNGRDDNDTNNDNRDNDNNNDNDDDNSDNHVDGIQIPEEEEGEIID